NAPPSWANTPAELLAGGQVPSKTARAAVTADGQLLNISGDDSKYGDQFFSALIPVNPHTDYVYMIPIKVEMGRIRISVKGSNGKVHGSAVAETQEQTSPGEQPVNEVRLPFVSVVDDRVRVVISNEAS